MRQLLVTVIRLKKPGAIEFEIHITISLMSNITKMLLRIIIMRVRKIKPEIAEERCGFVEKLPQMLSFKQ